jgi:hypothetical protein
VASPAAGDDTPQKYAASARHASSPNAEIKVKVRYILLQSSFRQQCDRSCVYDGVMRCMFPSASRSACWECRMTRHGTLRAGNEVLIGATRKCPCRMHRREMNFNEAFHFQLVQSFLATAL